MVADWLHAVRQIEYRTLAAFQLRWPHSVAETYYTEMNFLPEAFEPGQFVRHPTQPDWGLGQVQSALGTRVTVNFEHAGKVLINAAIVPLVLLEDGPA